TMKGSPLTLLGKEVRSGDSAPDFKALDQALKEVSLNDFKGKIVVIAAVPSLDTPVCDLQIKRFNDEAAKLSKDIKVLFVSMDLPFAQKRFCQEFSIKKVVTLSDHRDADFGMKYGVLIKELRLLSRAVFVIDSCGKVAYVEYVKELGHQPNYDAVLETIAKITK
ncbi:MAG TPA: thiol peroxidase, partial [Candidatus Omnitrophota bacterium]|nr:thiol peroxidase [Candidatus Omnitrophota bacterium]